MWKLPHKSEQAIKGGLIYCIALYLWDNAPDWTIDFLLHQTVRLGTGKEEGLNSTDFEILSESAVMNYWTAATVSYSEVSIFLCQ